MKSLSNVTLRNSVFLGASVGLMSGISLLVSPSDLQVFTSLFVSVLAVATSVGAALGFVGGSLLNRLFSGEETEFRPDYLPTRNPNTVVGSQQQLFVLITSKIRGSFFKLGHQRPPLARV